MTSKLYFIQLLRATRAPYSLRYASFTANTLTSAYKGSVVRSSLDVVGAIYKQSLPTFSCSLRYYSTPSTLSPTEFEQICEETLDSIAEYFEELAESSSVLKNSDVAYSDGVITAFLGEKFGTYVINRQTPNQQIWLSSPTSGPKRYDFINGCWIYKHDNTSLHNLLDKEIGNIIKSTVEFSSRCSFGNKG